MGTVIDELVIKLLLNTNGFRQASDETIKNFGKIQAASQKTQTAVEHDQKKSGDAQQKTWKLQERQIKSTLDGITSLKNEALAFLSVFTAGKGIKDFITSTAQSGLSLSQLAQNLGMSGAELDKWGKTIDRLGGDGKGFQNSLKGINDQFKTFSATGQAGQAVQVLRSLGVNIDYDAGGIKDKAKSIGQIADALHAMPKGRADTLGAMMGFSMADVQILEQGSAALKANYDATKGLTDEQIQQRQQTALQLAALKQDLENTGNQLLSDAAPAIKEILTLLDELAKFMTAHPRLLDTLAASALGFQALMAGKFVTGVLGSLFSVGKGVDGLALKFGALGKSAALAGKASSLVAAGSIGWDIGSFISEHFVEGTSAGDALGAGVTHVMAALGDREAQAAIERDKRNQQFAAQRRAGGSLKTTGSALTSLGGSALAALIARGEGDYNTVNRGAAHGYQAGTEDLENMTLDQVRQAQQAHRFNAAGRYQIIGGTLADAMKAMHLSGAEKFDRKMQDQIFSQFLMQHPGRALMDYVSGNSNDVMQAIYAAAKEWASVAVPKGMKTESGRISDGTSTYYDSSGKNKATLSVAQMTRALDSTRAAQLQGMPRPGAQMALAAKGYGAAQSAAGNSTEINIGNINVQTAATDAKAIAGDIGPAIRNNHLVSQANTGLA